MRFTCSPIRAPAGSGKSRRKAARSRCGIRNGRELFYRSGDKMMAVDIATQPGFAAGKPRMLFEGPYAAGSGQRSPTTTCLPTASAS